MCPNRLIEPTHVGKLPLSDKILAFADYELRLPLAGHLGSKAPGDPSVSAAAHFVAADADLTKSASPC